MSGHPSALVAQLRAILREGRESLADAYHADPDPARYLAARALLVDDVLRQLWRAQDLPPELALCAVGGYGRGELYPESDVDLLLLLPRPADTALEENLQRLVGLFWDIGLEVGHSVRAIEECLTAAKEDVTVATALLESRLLIGDAALYKNFRARFTKSLDRQEFFLAKRMEQAERHQRFQETPYNLEPHCKEAPGGLRDLQNLLWIAKGCGYGESWQALSQKHFFTEAVFRQIEDCERLLQNLRIRLHLLLKRREDRLLFDHQERLAQTMGLEAAEEKRASELLMQSYYRNAKRVTQINAVLLQIFAAKLLPGPRQTSEPIDAHFCVSGNFLDVPHENTFQKHPPALLKCFLLLQQKPELRGMTARALRALWRGREAINEDFRASPENRRNFLALFQNPRELIRAFHLMDQFSILGAYLPAFGKITGQMQYDLFHAYTVDQHILMVMRNLCRFALDEFAHENPFCSQLHNAFARPWVLYIAALFHDIAKGRGGDHAQLGMEDARAFCLAHTLEEKDTQLIVWLVGEHLSMSHTTQKEDISDPSVIADFAARVQNARRLTALYLLTVADIRATSPKVWNNWKAQLLESLYRQTLRHLESGAASEPQGIIAERQNEALRLLRYFTLSDTVHERLWRQFDTVYFLRHSAEEIAWHTRALHYRIHEEKPVVKARVHPGGGLQVMIYTRDEPDIFLRVAGFFTRAGYSVAEAKIHTTRHGYALDSFILLNVTDNAEDRDMIGFIESELARVLEFVLPVAPPSPGRVSRQVKHFPITPEIQIYPDERGAHYILSIITADRPGLLYRVADALARHKIFLHTARIATLGERAEDVFLISGRDLDQNTARLRLEQEILGILKNLD